MISWLSLGDTMQHTGRLIRNTGRWTRRHSLKRSTSLHRRVVVGGRGPAGWENAVFLHKLRALFFLLKLVNQKEKKRTVGDL